MVVVVGPNNDTDCRDYLVPVLLSAGTRLCHTTVDTISQAFTDSMTVSLTGIIFRNRLGEREEWEGQREDYSMVR